MSGYKHCVTESAADRQRQFEAALLELMGHKHYSQISVQEICDRVGLSRKSFYRYFSNKEMCLTALVDHTILDYRTEPLPGHALTDSLTHYFHYWYHHRSLLEALAREHLVDILIQRSIASVIEEGDFFQKVSGRDVDMHQDEAIFLISGLVGVLLHWHQEGCQASPAQLASTLEQMLSQHSRSVF